VILNIKAILFSSFLLLCGFSNAIVDTIEKDSKPTGIDRVYVLESINKLRAKGCKCGQEYFPPVPALTWNDVLYKSAFLHAKSMHEEDYFSHISPDGKVIAVLGYGTLWLITNFEFDDFSKGDIHQIDLGLRTQLEAVCFKNQTTLLLSDERAQTTGNNLYEFRIKP